MRTALLLAIVCVANVAHAETPAELVAEGRRLAGEGEFTRAITKFKEADAIEPTAENACLIGLAYTRRELWSQAELYFDRCKERTKAGDPPPDWANEAIATLAAKLSSTGVSAIEIRVAPAVPDVAISVSGFSADETFAPRTVHLAPGTYVLTATAPGHSPVREKLVVVGTAPQTITLSFDVKPSGVHAKPVRPTSQWFFVGAVGLALVGGGFHLVSALERSKLQDAVDANDPALWDKHDPLFRYSRAGAIAGYSLAAITLTIGLVVRSRETPVVDVVAGPSGAVVAFTWQR